MYSLVRVSRETTSRIQLRSGQRSSARHRQTSLIVGKKCRIGETSREKIISSLLGNGIEGYIENRVCHIKLLSPTTILVENMGINR
jgi:hypothetical protein